MFNTILANRIEAYIEKFIHHGQLDFISEVQHM